MSFPFRVLSHLGISPEKMGHQGSRYVLGSKGCRTFGLWGVEFRGFRIWRGRVPGL